MSEFLDAALGYPTALFSFALVVVIGYWGSVLLGGLDVDALGGGHGGEGVDAHHGDHVDHGDHGHTAGFAGFLAGLGLGGVPVTVTMSLLIGIAWFAALAGRVLTGGGPLSGTVALAGALVCSWAGTRALLLPLRRLVPRERAPSRSDFVGKVCVVRTGRVSAGFGQAEVTADDGSTAVVQVRTTGTDEGLVGGSTALIFDYDAVRECFLVAPYDASLDPDRRPAV
ncbi:OB-fold-containig protein [Actinacidiphila glaucinigra]|uniref:DUF1449 family protein n=1 Tax=Actinacidiphila glaucinigra TaxID=235986 RepID=A0A239NI54_9ACTN|nr:OB-fold-containig protein [Actinacidiphila glaucinigra]SNT54008.1 Protein of unknown function [Actinacidiphila glaucinigra]